MTMEYYHIQFPTKTSITVLRSGSLREAPGEGSPPASPSYTLFLEKDDAGLPTCTVCRGSGVDVDDEICNVKALYNCASSAKLNIWNGLSQLHFFIPNSRRSLAVLRQPKGTMLPWKRSQKKFVWAGRTFAWVQRGQSHMHCVEQRSKQMVAQYDQQTGTLEVRGDGRDMADILVSTALSMEGMLRNWLGE